MSNSAADHGLQQWHGTTIIGVKRGDTTVLAGDGQVSMGNTVMKPNAKKVRRIGESPERISSFGIDADGELLLVGYEGTLFRVVLDDSVFE